MQEDIYSNSRGEMGLPGPKASDKSSSESPVNKQPQKVVSRMQAQGV